MQCISEPRGENDGELIHDLSCVKNSPIICPLCIIRPLAIIYSRQAILCGTNHNLHDFSLRSALSSIRKKR